MAAVPSRAHAPRAPCSLEVLQQRFTELVQEARLVALLRARLNHLPAADRDDRIAEGLAVAWRAFNNKATRPGVLLAAPHLVWIALRHARDNRLRLVGGDDTTGYLAPPQRAARVSYSDIIERQLASRPRLEVREDARRYLAQASRDERQLLALHVEGRSFAEIGKHLGVDKATACRRLHRTCAELRRRVARA